MFGFDGEYRRRPLQSLGGASQTCDRDTVIRKAKQERQKRDELRRQNNGAIIIQSYIRSFLSREQRKRFERDEFDQFLSQHRERIMSDDENVSFLLRRILFFYNHKEHKDGERLIELCQQILRNPARLLKNSVTDNIWQHRLKKLIDLCITQLEVPQIAQAIPLRMLETFTASASVERYIESEQLLRKYLESILSYLVERAYFMRLRRLLDLKCPPLDGECVQPPNQITEALLQLILRPLLIIKYTDSNGGQCSAAITKSILLAFIKAILARAYSVAVRDFLLPSLAQHADFPFELLLNVLHAEASQQQCEKMEIDPNNATNTTTALTTSASSSFVSFGSNKNASPTQIAKTAAKEEKAEDNCIFSSFLLNSLLILDRQHLAKLNSSNALGNYITTLAAMTPLFLKYPKSNSQKDKMHAFLFPTCHNFSSDEEDEVDDDDDSDNERVLRSKKKNSCDANNVSIQNSVERAVLLECVELLNEPQRVQLIIDNVEECVLQHTHVLQALCEICHNLMIYNKYAIFEYKLLYSLAFMPSIIRSVWFTLAAQSTQLGFSAPLTLISKGVVPKQNGVERTISLLATFCMLFGRLLPTLHDTEFIEDKRLLLEQSALLASAPHVRLMPFSIMEIVQLSKTLKEISMGLVELAFPETRSNLNQHYRLVLGHSDADERQIKQQKQIWANLLKVVVFVLNQIHTRDLRLGFCPDEHWIIARLDLPLDRPTDLPLTRGVRMRGIRPFQPIRDFTREDVENGPPMSTKQIRSITILREIPFVVSFSKRVGILQGLVAADKIRVQGNYQNFLQGPAITISVRRTHLYEDAFDKLRSEIEPDLRLKFRVALVSQLGLDEAGIDGGGVFREFLSELIKTAFDPNRGFFMVTTDNKLYPNPNVGDLVPDFERHYHFIARILGKAIYENLLVELPLAEFFLTKLAGKYADVDIHQLASLDPELYKNLLYLKDYVGDVSELNLDFTVASSSLGQTQVLELKPNGRNIPVTGSNRIEYVQLMADYKLNVQIRQHCSAFRSGLSDVLPVEWLYMFSNKELQILISGAEIPIDWEDLKRHCKYGGEYSPEHPSIICFWKALDGFDDLERRQLLKFVTSCSRPPLLGFKDLDPPFFIQNAGDMERLPTASTCTNLLKLPPFRTAEQMREKLLYAIQAGVGFELS